jgi:hypothetical protein
VQLAARRMDSIKIEVEKEGEFVRAKFFNEGKAGEAKSKEAAKEVNNNSNDNIKQKN